jgi:hypothetical protein
MILSGSSSAQFRPSGLSSERKFPCKFLNCRSHVKGKKFSELECFPACLGRRVWLFLRSQGFAAFFPVGLMVEFSLFLAAIVCKAVGGVATETLVDVEKVESSRETNVDAGKEPSDSNWKIKMLYDGDCPLCMREVHRSKTL